MRWTPLPLLRMNHFRYVYYRKQGYRRISPSAICFVSTFIKHSGHFCHELLDNLFMAVSHVKCNKCLAYGFIICWKSYCLHCNYVLCHEKKSLGVCVTTVVWRRHRSTCCIFLSFTVVALKTIIWYSVHLHATDLNYCKDILFIRLL